jgi:hypothetical protein
MTTLREQESALLADIWAYLDKIYPSGSKQMKVQFEHLDKLGELVSSYPDIQAAQIVWGENSLTETLMDNAASFNSSKLYMPPRVILWNGFLMTKLHNLSMLSTMIGGIEGFLTPLRSSMFFIVCMLLAEKVLFTCLEDKHFPQDSKLLLVNELIALWDGIPDPKDTYYFQFLESLWQQRYVSPPVFGTLAGTAETLRLSLDMPKNQADEWSKFLIKASSEMENNNGKSEIQWALDEFVFGHALEDIQEVREKMQLAGRMSIGRDEFYQYCSAKAVKSRRIKYNDPRTFYNFFIHRRNRTRLRRQSNSLTGPWQTLEEMFLEYLTGKG